MTSFFNKFKQSLFIILTLLSNKINAQETGKSIRLHLNFYVLIHIYTCTCISACVCMSVCLFSFLFFPVAVLSSTRLIQRVGVFYVLSHSPCFVSHSLARSLVFSLSAALESLNAMLCLA